MKASTPFVFKRVACLHLVPSSSTWHFNLLYIFNRISINPQCKESSGCRMYKHAKKTLLNSTVGVTKSRFHETSGCEEFHSFEILEAGEGGGRNMVTGYEISILWVESPICFLNAICV